MATPSELRGLLEAFQDASGKLVDELDETVTRLEDEGTTEADPAEDRRAFEKATLAAFGNWVLDLLDPTGADVLDQVKRARPQLVAALSGRHAPTVAEHREARARISTGFIDVTAEDGDEELGIRPFATS